MPPRDTPTARQARLGAELRKLREKAGRTARETAGLLGVDQARVSNIESGRMGIGEERIRRLAAFYSCGDGALIDALCAIARERRGEHWWDEYRGILPPAFLDLAELEHHATYLRSSQIVCVPGILQTEGYARVLFSEAVPLLPPEEVDARVGHRMRRRVILERDDPPPFVAIVHEAALRMRFGGRKVIGEQLEWLMEVSCWPKVTLLIIPFATEEFVEVTQPALYAGGVVPQLDTVQLDLPFGGVHLNAEAELDRHRKLLDNAEAVALLPEASRQLIHHIAREL
ncbi:helix-turn-helix transcriptional regulator [Streptomyces sp. NPDC003077]|uniref:helix-turn-helix domain-containing protein n=1 Tax=Streptomyces sp. NPDC003077 TaxID=3154443 RepID=UPI0033BADE33